MVAFTFACMIFAIVPWAQVINGPSAESFGWQLDWYFPELAALFIVMSIVVGLIGGLGEKGLTDTIVRGAGDFIGVGLIIVLARGVTVIMNNSMITDTVLHSMENAVSGTIVRRLRRTDVPDQPARWRSWCRRRRAMRRSPCRSLLPLSDFAGVSRAMTITAYQSASGLINLITPTSAVVMGGLALAKVRYDQYLRFVLPLVAILFVACLAFVAVGAAIS